MLATENVGTVRLKNHDTNENVGYFAAKLFICRLVYVATGRFTEGWEDNSPNKAQKRSQKVEHISILESVTCKGYR